MDNAVNNPELKYQLLSDFKLFEDHMNGEASSPVHKIRQSAISAFDRLGFPVKKMEEWKYTNLNSVIKNHYRQALIPQTINLTPEDIEKYLVPGMEANIITLVNGRFSSKLSKIITDTEGVFVGSFSEGYAKHNDIVTEHFAKYADYENHAMTALNTAFAQDGVFIYAGKSKAIQEPVLIINIADAREEILLSQPRDLIVLEESSSVTMIEESFTIGDKSCFGNSVSEIVVKPNARMEHYRMQNDADTAYQVNTTQVNQHKDSYYSSTVISWGGSIIRNDLNTLFTGENGECHFFGLYLLDGKEHVDNHTLADHAVPNCYSNELYKGIMDDNSTGVFNGKIMVREDAQKTNAYQSNNNILISDDATINTKPQLEIFADDVKCSHGATSGQLDKEALFYLRARGLGEREARTLLLYAFANDVIDSIKIEPLREYLSARCMRKLRDKS